MVTEVSFTKRIPPGAAQRGTLAELMARQKDLASRQSEFGQVQPIQSWTQGLAQMGGALSTGLQQRSAANEETAGREALAKLISGIGPEGATAEQTAQMGMYDPQIAQQYHEEAIQARRDAAAAAAAIANREDEQLFRQGESAAEREARHAENAAQLAVTTRGQDIGATTAEGQMDVTRRGQDIGAKTAEGQMDITRRGQDITADTAASEQGVQRRGQDLTAAGVTAKIASEASEAAKGRLATRDLEHFKVEAQTRAAALAADVANGKPLDPRGQLMHDYNTNNLGGAPGSPVADKNLAAGMAKLNEPSKAMIVNTGDPGASAFAASAKATGEKVYPQYKEEGARAGKLIRAMDLLGEIDPNSQGPVVGRLAQILPGFSSQAALFDSITKGIAPSQREPGAGSTSDIEYQGFLDALPQLRNHPEANDWIRGYVKAQANVAVQRAHLVAMGENKQYTAEFPDDAHIAMAIDALNSQSLQSPELKRMIDSINANKPIDVPGQPAMPKLAPGVTSIEPG